MRVIDVIGFGTLAIGLHVGGLWYVLDRQNVAGDSGAAGENGQDSISLAIDGGRYQDLVKAWDTPPETQIEMAELVDPLSGPSLTAPTRPIDAAIPMNTNPALESPALEPSVPAPKAIERSAISPPTLPQLDVPSLNTDTPALTIIEAADSATPMRLPQRPAPMQPAVQPDVDDAAPLSPTTAPKMLAPGSSLRPQARPTQRPQQAAPKIVQTAKGVSKSNTTNKTAGSAPRPSQAPQTNGTEKQALSDWSNGVRRAIERKKRYPRGTRASGTVTISLKVSRSGTLLGASVTKSSGTAALDQAALKAVQSARYPTAPETVTRNSATFQVPITLKR